MELLTVEEVARILKLNEQTIRRWLQSGKLVGVKISETAWRVEQSKLDEFIKNSSQ